MNNDIVYKEFLLFAEELVNESGIILKKAFKNKIEYEIKGDQSFITKYDLLIEELFRNRITKKYSNHGILGEEFKSHKTESEFVWVLDPIDGTAQFIAGLPVFGTLIGLAWKGKPLIGIIDNPVTNERWIGITGQYAKKNRKIIKTSDCSNINNAYMVCSSPDFMNKNELKYFSKIKKKVNYVQYGGSCHSYGLLANGRVDVAIDCSLAPFDYFANAAIISGAGGYLSKWDGDDVDLNWVGAIIATGNIDLHNQLISLLN